MALYTDKQLRDIYNLINLGDRGQYAKSGPLFDKIIEMIEFIGRLYDYHKFWTYDALDVENATSIQTKIRSYANWNPKTNWSASFNIDHIYPWQILDSVTFVRPKGVYNANVCPDLTFNFRNLDKYVVHASFHAAVYKRDGSYNNHTYNLPLGYDVQSPHNPVSYRINTSVLTDISGLTDENKAITPDLNVGSATHFVNYLRDFIEWRCYFDVIDKDTLQRYIIGTELDVLYYVTVWKTSDNTYWFKNLNCSALRINLADDSFLNDTYCSTPTFVIASS